METLKFPYSKGKGVAHFSFQMVGDCIALSPLMRVLALNPAKLRLIKAAPPTQMIRIGAVATEGISMPALTEWLPKVGKLSTLCQHFADHLVPFISNSSTTLAVTVAAEREYAKQRAAKAPTVLCEPLEPVDHFRKDASTLGIKRERPAVIAAAARVGFVDVFVRPSPSMWDAPGALPGIQRVNINLREGYHSRLLQDLRRTSMEVLSGLEMVGAYPTHPQVERKTVPPRRIAVADGPKPVIETIPAHPQLFPWERAVIESATHDDDIVLPGSPYNGKRPAWLGY